jgi:aminopeptidase N
MPGNNLSRAEAAERSSHLTMKHYDILLDVTTGEETFHATTKVTFSCSKPGYDTFIDAAGKRVISATLNGAPVDVSNYDGESIFLKNLQAENELIIEIEAIYSKSGEGLQRSVDPVDNEVYLYSQGETAFIRNMYPCFDQPDLKATFAISAIAPAHWQVISNNPVKTVTETAGKKKWEFTTTPVMSTYITALVAGPYSFVSDEYKGKKTIPMSIYCRKSLFEHLDADEVFLITKQGFAYFEEVFGLAYPFDKYDQIAVVDFNWGAMENAGAVTFREDLLVFRSKVTERMYNARANTILHEMAHMWFGDMVTMKWWDDLWLNESFAEWTSYLALVEATKFKNSWVGFNAERKNWAYRQDQLSSTHPIASDMVDIDTVKANFDGITYAKGASVLHQLVAHVGRDNFIKGLQKYFAKHAFRNTTLQDLLSELEATSGRDLTPWVSTWLQTAGVNTLRPVVEINGGTYAAISVLQEPPMIPEGSQELRPHRMAVGLYDLKDGVLARRKSLANSPKSTDSLAKELPIYF